MFVINVAFGRADDPTLLQRDIFPADSDTLRYGTLTRQCSYFDILIYFIYCSRSIDDYGTRSSSYRQSNLS